MKYPWSLRIIFHPCLNLVFPVGSLTLKTISPLEKIHFSSFFESPGLDVSRIVKDHFLPLFKLLTFENYFIFEEKIHFSLFLESPGHDLSPILEDQFLSLFKSCFTRWEFNCENYFPFGENTFFLVSWISRSWRDPRGLQTGIVLSLIIPWTWWGVRRSLSSTRFTSLANVLPFLTCTKISSFLNICIDGERDTPAWGENLDTTRLCSMIVFNNTGNKDKSLLLFYFNWTH